MKYLIGAVLTPAACALYYDARRHRARVLEARAEAIRNGRPAEQTIAPDSLAALGEMISPIILMVLTFIALKLTLAFSVLDPMEYFTPVDLTGTLLLILAYGVWVKTRSTMRMPQDGATSVQDFGDAASLPGAVIFDGRHAEPMRSQTRQLAQSNKTPKPTATPAYARNATSTAGARVAILSGPRHASAVAHDTQPNFEQE